MIRRRRVSIHPVQREYPRGVRRRGWGYLHDQIWNEVLPGDPDAHVIEVLRDRFLHEGQSDVWLRIDGRLRWYRRDHATDVWYRVYMDRRMIWLPRWLGSIKIRMHEFLLGDDDSAPHDHPWPFVTFPLDTYEETVEEEDPEWSGFQKKFRRTVRIVHRFRFHYRPAEYRHFVHEHPSRFVRTIVITWGRTRKWGFWPEPDKFVPFSEWAKYD